jgi:hypothetical protein
MAISFPGDGRCKRVIVLCKGLTCFNACPVCICAGCSCSELQAKLDQLKSLAEGNFIDNFVKEFVPKDLEVRCYIVRPLLSALFSNASRNAKPSQEEDLVEFTKRQKDFPEEWENLKSEIFAIATGTGVTRIDGDQV